MPEATEATMVIGKLLGRCNVPAFADPNLKIRGSAVIQTLHEIRGMKSRVSLLLI